MLGHRPSGGDDDPCKLSPSHESGIALWSSTVTIAGTDCWNAALIYNPAVGQPDLSAKRKKKPDATDSGSNDDAAEDDAATAFKTNAARHAAVRKFVDSGSFGTVYNVTSSPPLREGCPKAHWAKGKGGASGSWIRTDFAWVKPDQGSATGKKDRAIMPWTKQSGCQSRLMAVRYFGRVLGLSDKASNDLLKAKSPDGFYITAMRFRSVRPVKVNGKVIDSLEGRVNEFLDSSVAPTNTATKPGALPVRHQVSPKDVSSGAGETRHPWQHRFIAMFRREYLLQIQAVSFIEGMHLGYALHEMLVWALPTKDHPTGYVHRLCSTAAEAAEILPATDVDHVKKLYEAIAAGGNGAAICIRCKCSAAWNGKPLAVGFSKCKDTCGSGSCSDGCDTGSAGHGEHNLDTAYRVLIDLLRVRNRHKLLAALTQASPRTMSRKMGVNWAGVSLSLMQSLLACDDLNWTTGSEAYVAAMKWRDALVTVGELGAGVGANKTHQSPLVADNFSLALAGRRTLSKAIGRCRGATHLDEGMQKILLARVVTRQAESAASHASAEPTAADYDDADDGN